MRSTYLGAKPFFGFLMNTALKIGLALFASLVLGALLMGLMLVLGVISLPIWILIMLFGIVVFVIFAILHFTYAVYAFIDEITKEKTQVSDGYSIGQSKESK